MSEQSTTGDLKNTDDQSSTSVSRRDERIQALGRQVVSTLYMLVRNVKIHSPDNAIFLKPIEQFREAVNRLVAGEGQLNLHAVKSNVYLNNTIVKFDFAALQNVEYLTKEFEARDMGGFSTKRPVTAQEIRDFLYLFTSEYKGNAPEVGADGRELPSLRVARLAFVREILEKLQQQEVDLDQQIDRKKYLMTVYARSIFFMRKYFETIAQGKPLLPFAKAARLIQDLVDLCKDQRTHFLGLTTTKSESDYLPFHSVNCALLSIVFGGELGLDRRQLHDLGMAALFSQVGVSELPEEVMTRRGGLTRQERAMVDLFPLRSAKRILQGRGLDKTTMSRVVATFESKIDYAIPHKGEDGEMELVTPKVNLGIYGRIIAIVDCFDALTSKRPFREAYGPEVALALMSGDMKYKFDPVLLRIFMKTMAIQPVRVLNPADSSFRIG
jgi:HD-GYP domain-containing protein (c-di-GMP phosphodiesterase class II)